MRNDIELIKETKQKGNCITHGTWYMFKYTLNCETNQTKVNYNTKKKKMISKSKNINCFVSAIKKKK